MEVGVGVGRKTMLMEEVRVLPGMVERGSWWPAVLVGMCAGERAGLQGKG